MKTPEMGGQKPPKRTAEALEKSLAERIEALKLEIVRQANEGDFDRVIELSAALETHKRELAEKEREEERKKNLPTELRMSIAGAEERLRAIEDGTFLISDTDPNLKPTILRNIRERIEITKEDLLIAEGARPTYEAQVEALRKEIEDLTEPYARRWAELVESGDTERMLAFADGRTVGLLYEEGDPYEVAKWSLAVAVRMGSEAAGARQLRDSLQQLKEEFENSIRRSE